MEAQTVLANPIPRAQFCLSNCKLDGELNPPLWKRGKHRGSCPCKTLPVSGAHRGLINEVFKRVAITPQPRRAASFCSTNWSTGAVLTLPLAGLAWELHPKPGTFWARCAANPICCPGRERIPWKDLWESLGRFYLTFPVTRGLWQSCQVGTGTAPVPLPRQREMCSGCRLLTHLHNCFHSHFMALGSRE